MCCVLFFAALLMPTIVVALPLMVDENVSLVNIRLINEIHSPRFKRSFQSEDGVKTLPDHLVFGVPVKEDNDAILRLKRTSLVPTITSSGTVDTRIPNQNVAIYTDMSHHSAMIVRRQPSDYSIQGTFHHLGKEWDIHPLHDNSTSQKYHQLSPLRAKEKQDEIISLDGDTFGINDTRTGDSHIKNVTRYKRDVTQHVIEIAFIVDYADYNKWVTLVGSSNAIPEMQLWYTYVAESINIRYNTIQDSDIAIGTRTTILKIITSDSDDDFIEAVTTNGAFNGIFGLNAFQRWVRNQRDVPPSDHYMLFTGFNIHGTNGVAYGNTMCTPSSISIIENGFTASTGRIAAHQLGHCLSALHDTSSGCSDSDQFIMATTFTNPVDYSNQGNPWRFSPCSIARFKSKLNQVTCTLPASTTGYDILPAPQDGDRAGQVLSLDHQCKRALRDTSSFFCQATQGDLDTVCGGMYCYRPGRGNRCQMVLPQEYSGCGDGLWCSLGECVDKTSAPTPEPGIPNLLECARHILRWRKLVECIRGKAQDRRNLE